MGAAPCSIWDISSSTRDRTRAPYIGSAESQPLDHQGIPHVTWFFSSFKPILKKSTRLTLSFLFYTRIINNKQEKCANLILLDISWLFTNIKNICLLLAAINKWPSSLLLPLKRVVINKEYQNCIYKYVFFSLNEDAWDSSIDLLNKGFST